MADLSVRPARLGDVAALADVQRGCWTEVVPDLEREGELDTLARGWERAVLLPPTSRHRVLVALSGVDVVGFAATAPASDPDLDPATTDELLELGVAPGHRRAGHGSRLLAAAMDLSTSDGTGVAVAWVPSTADRTRRFLAEAGWAADGAHRTLDLRGDGAVQLRQIRLGTDLSPAPAP